MQVHLGSEEEIIERNSTSELAYFEPDLPVPWRALTSVDPILEALVPWVPVLPVPGLLRSRPVDLVPRVPEDVVLDLLEDLERSRPVEVVKAYRSWSGRGRWRWRRPAGSVYCYWGVGPAGGLGPVTAGGGCEGLQGSQGPAIQAGGLSWACALASRMCHKQE
eukprot:1158604-Pelagomonas_calceolata.AAC.6